METVLELHPQSRWRHLQLRVTSKRALQFIDLTDRIQRLVADAALRTGFINIQTRHTTTAIVVNEHEPLLLADFSDVLEQLAGATRCYRHDDAERRVVNVTPDERVNGHAHCRALLLPSSACLNVVAGRLQLGQWQRILFVELDGPRERSVSTVIFGEHGR
jgi:secondary thiamine-phosphate synthase enzyme